MQTVKLLALLAGMSCLSTVALAGPITTQNTTTVVGSDGNNYSSIGSEFQTTSVTTGLTKTGNNAYTETISFATDFPGSANVGGYNIYDADIFIGGSNDKPAYAIGLGDETANGGLATAGLYTVGSYKTSEQIWGGRSNTLFGAGYLYNGKEYAAPTVLTGGGRYSGVNIVEAFNNDVFTITLTGLTFLDSTIFSGSSLFWGTGDCANGAIYAPVNSTLSAVAEPAGMAIFLLGVGVLYIYTRRHPYSKVTCQIS